VSTANEWAASMAADLDMHAALWSRTMQKGLGVSDVGSCHSKALYKHTGVAPTNAPRSRQALHGTALHDLFTAARMAGNSRLIHNTAVETKLPSGLVVVGHADEIDPDEPSVTDFKTVGDRADLTVTRREGSDEQQRFQRHLYYLGAHQAGLVPAQGIVRNWWCDRAGQDPWGHVEQEPYDPDVVYAADDWLQTIVYAAEHGEEVPRDRHHDWCRQFCEFFTHCRGELLHDDYLVQDEAMIAGARRVHEGRKLEREGKAMVEVGRRALEPLQLSAEGDVGAFLAGQWRVRWTSMNRPTGQAWRLAVDAVSPE
jgi:hypothetical protein